MLTPRRVRKVRAPRPRRTGRPLLAEMRRDCERLRANASVHVRPREMFVIVEDEPWPEPLPARC